MTKKQSVAAAAVFLAAAATWITWPKFFVLAAIIAIVWFSLATTVALIIGRAIAIREEQK